MDTIGEVRFLFCSVCRSTADEINCLSGIRTYRVPRFLNRLTAHVSKTKTVFAKSGLKTKHGYCAKSIDIKLWDVFNINGLKTNVTFVPVNDVAMRFAQMRHCPNVFLKYLNIDCKYRWLASIIYWSQYTNILVDLLFINMYTYV